MSDVPQFFLHLADSYRELLDNRVGGIWIRIYGPNIAAAAMLKTIGPSLRGPAKWITSHKRSWDDVDIAHVVRAAYELYGDERLNIGDNPHKGYVGGKYIGDDIDGAGYGNDELHGALNE